LTGALPQSDFGSLNWFGLKPAGRRVVTRL
jgi:hypothetical protein